jgi:hypothetical protein
MLMSDDFPTLERPMKAYSGFVGFGSLAVSVLLCRNDADLMIMMKFFAKIVKIYIPIVISTETEWNGAISDKLDEISPLRLSASVEMTLVEVATLEMTGTLLITFLDVDNSVDKFFENFC